MNSRWATWSPFESATVREIKAHMTADERAEYTEISREVGAYLGVAISLPICLWVFFGDLALVVPVAIGAMGLVFAIFATRFRRRVKELFCSTYWARLNRIEPGNLRLHRF